jgi:hypothetical protein
MTGARVRSGLTIHDDEVMWPDPRRPRPKGELRRRAMATAAAVALLIAATAGFVIVTFYTGFPAPGAVRRYPNSDLQALADQINALPCEVYAGPIEPGSNWSPPPRASVDRGRSRVHLRGRYLVLLPPEDVALVDNPGDTAPTLGCHP